MLVIINSGGFHLSCLQTNCSSKSVGTKSVTHTGSKDLHMDKIRSSGCIWIHFRLGFWFSYLSFYRFVCQSNECILLSNQDLCTSRGNAVIIKMLSVSRSLFTVVRFILPG